MLEFLGRMYIVDYSCTHAAVSTVHLSAKFIV